MIAGATAEVALEKEGKIIFVSSERLGRGHDHAGGEEAALESLGARNDCCIGWSSPWRPRPWIVWTSGPLAVRGDETVLGRLAIEPDRTGPAIAGITPFFHAEPAVVRRNVRRHWPGWGSAVKDFPLMVMIRVDSLRRSSRADLFGKIIGEVPAV